MADSLLDGNQPSSLTREQVIEKWKDKPQEELLAAKAESDLFIETMKARFDDLRKDYLELKEQQQTGAQLKELIDRLDSRDNNVQPPITQENSVQPGIKPEDVQILIQNEIAKNKQLTRQEENFLKMQAKLRETLGDNYQDSYKQRLDTLGLTTEFADELAKNYPTAFMRTFGLDQQATSPSNSAPPRSSQRPSSFAPTAPKRDWAYYQELKKANPRLYLDPKIAVQMHDDAVALGDSFGMPQD